MKLRNLAAGFTLAGMCGGAVADLYLWKDPTTGTVKIYSYPPPWYGNEALERRAPKVERIPERQRAPAVRPEAAPLALPPLTPPPAQLGPLEAQRKRLLGEMAAMRERKDPGLPQRLLVYQDLVSQMDRIDPAGAATRSAETRALIERTQ